METNYIDIITPKQKARFIVLKMWDNTPGRFFDENSELTEHNYLGITDCIDCAIICVDEIIDAFISGGRDSFELQNMDKEFRFWYEVKDELNRMKS